MTINKAFLSSFGWSLVIGAIVFLFIPIAYFILAGLKDSEIYFVLVLMYFIYFIIQFFLSFTHLIQASLLQVALYTHPDRMALVERFLLSELVLYIIIFFPISFGLKLNDAYKLVFAFSIPYIFCCTSSIFLSIHFIYNKFRSESNES